MSTLFIDLTGSVYTRDGEIPERLSVNIASIQTIEDADKCESKGSHINTSTRFFFVRETRKQVLELIKDAEQESDEQDRLDSLAYAKELTDYQAVVFSRGQVMGDK